MKENQQDPKVDPINRKILNRIQADFPLVQRPFAEMAQSLGTTEEEVLERVRQLFQAKIIRQIGPIFDTRNLGYASSLVAFRIPQDKLIAGAKMINSHPGVSHNYERNNDFNLWFTIAVPPGENLEKHIEALTQLTHAESGRILQTIQLFKIGVRLDIGDAVGGRGREEDDFGVYEKIAGAPSAEEQRMIAVLQENIELTEEPFAKYAKQLDTTQEKVLEALHRFKEKGYMRRFAAILRHRKAGFMANGMAVWKVPPERATECGQIMANFRVVSHCYQRPTYPDWPYALFSMIHAKTEEACCEAAREISEATKLTDYAVLFSLREFKKSRVRYFDGSIQQWTAQYVH
ncbi:MAG: AsnC family transcriptional regulator [Deltaproteobacteria bacterium]|nr:AsnC family transcriptional regulator [Deltaproteobacteria bacterium]